MKTRWDSCAAQNNIWNIRNVSIPTPSLKEQKRIVTHLRKLEEQTPPVESHYQQELDALDKLKKSILQKTFKGELQGITVKTIE